MTGIATAPWDWLSTPAPHHRRYVGDWAQRTLAQDAAMRADRTPDMPVFIAGEASATHAEVFQDAEALAVSLADLGLRPGDVVSFQMPNMIEAAVLNLACALSGLVVNPIVTIYRDAEVRLMLADARSKAFFVVGAFRNHDYAAMAQRLAPGLPDLQHIVVARGEGGLGFEELVRMGRCRTFARPRVDPGSVKLVLYTSGTTGRPKAVLHSHNTLNRVLARSAAHWGISEGDAIIMPSPVTHISGYANGLEMPYVAGSRTVLMPIWSAAEALELIDRHKVVGTVAATPFLTELAGAARQAGTRLPSFRFFACGGAAVPPEVIPSANAAFENCHAFRVFGASEVPLVTLGYPRAADEALAAATDGAVLDYEVRIVDGQDQAVPAGAEGEILARGPAMFLGYADRQQTAEAITADGYFRTGDIGILTPEGALLITGRKKDLIIRGGENISAKEIEDVLHTHPDVREAAIVAMPHARLGEGVCAYVILTAGAVVDAAALAAHVRASGLASQKAPERFVFVEDFPRTASGKIRKDQLRADVKARMAAGS